jgi:hypothetical protein
MARFCASAWLSFYPANECKLFRVQRALGPQETKRLSRHREARLAEQESPSSIPLILNWLRTDSRPPEPASNYPFFFESST